MIFDKPKEVYSNFNKKFLGMRLKLHPDNPIVKALIEAPPAKPKNFSKVGWFHITFSMDSYKVVKYLLYVADRIKFLYYGELEDLSFKDYGELQVYDVLIVHGIDQDFDRSKVRLKKLIMARLGAQQPKITITEGINILDDMSPDLKYKSAGMSEDFMQKIWQITKKKKYPVELEELENL